jgi:hypothetical protein
MNVWRKRSENIRFYPLCPILDNTRGWRTILQNNPFKSV